MKAGATRNYKDGPKNNWRRTHWNDTLLRTDGREKHDYVIYMPGSQDLDRAVAVRKGVRPENLIAVDENEENVQRVRDAGGFAVCADVIDVMLAWPEHRPVAAVMLDFTGGLSRGNAFVSDALLRKPFRHSAVSLNLLRGRDGWSNFWRDSETEPSVKLHRGRQFIEMMAGHVAGTFYGIGSVDSERIEWALLQAGRMATAIARRAQPKYFSYKSGRQVYDSVVFVASGAEEALSQLTAEESVGFENAVSHMLRLQTRSVRRAARRLSAMFAIRTMRVRKAA